MYHIGLDLARYNRFVDRSSFVSTTRRALGAALVVVAVAPPVPAQRVDDRATELMSELESAPLPHVPPPPLVFVARSEVAVPGPLDGTGPSYREGAVGVRAAGGVVLVPWSTTDGLAETVRGPAPEPVPEEPSFGLSTDGTTRAQVLDTGHLVVETACRRCRDGWNRKFRLRLVGSAIAPPVITENRVFFAARDNVVYGVRRKNGKRVWDHPVSGRVASRLVLWSGSPGGTSSSATASPVALILAVTDEPSALVALDARTGEPVCTYEAGAERTIVGAPLVLDDGRLVVARQDYRSTDAALVLLETVWREPAPPSAPPG